METSKKTEGGVKPRSSVDTRPQINANGNVVSEADAKKLAKSQPVSFLTRLGQIYFCMILLQYTPFLGLEIIFTTIVRLIRKHLLGITADFNGYSYEIVKPFIWLAFRVAGVQLKVSKPANVRLNSETTIFLYTHSSNIDVMTLLYLLPSPISFVAKAELLRLPLFGAIFRWGRTIPIEREVLSEAKNSLHVAEGYLKQGRHVALAPEGTRRRRASLPGRSGGETLAEFKKGSFHVAKNTGVRMLPVLLSGANRLFGPSNALVNPGTLYVDFLEPVTKEEVRAAKDHEELRLHTQKLISDKLRVRVDEEVLGRPGDNFLWIVGYTLFLFGCLWLAFMRK